MKELLVQLFLVIPKRMVIKHHLGAVMGFLDAFVHYHPHFPKEDRVKSEKGCSLSHFHPKTNNPRDDDH
jgi:hypothetical protein